MPPSSRPASLCVSFERSLALKMRSEEDFHIRDVADGCGRNSSGGARASDEKRRSGVVGTRRRSGFVTTECQVYISEAYKAIAGCTTGGRHPSPGGGKGRGQPSSSASSHPPTAFDELRASFTAAGALCEEEPAEGVPMVLLLSPSVFESAELIDEIRAQLADSSGGIGQSRSRRDLLESPRRRLSQLASRRGGKSSTPTMKVASECVGSEHV